MNLLHHVTLSGSMETVDYILKHHYRIFEHFSTDGHQVFDTEENDNLSWSMLKSAPIHYCVYAACGILPAGTPYLNITSYFTMMQKSAGERVQGDCIVPKVMRDKRKSSSSRGFKEPGC